MFRVVAIGVSILVLLFAYAHFALGGLIIGLHKDGSVWYSNELVSSGSDESSILTMLGFGSFLLSLIFYSVRRTGTKWFYFINLGWLYFILWLVNLDVSILNSINHGDVVLAILIIVVHIPVIYHLTNQSKFAFGWTR